MQQLLLLTQRVNAGIVTILHGEVPVIRLGETGNEDPAFAAVNFLRSGCPLVQLYQAEMEYFPRNTEEIRRLLKPLELPEEHFKVSIIFPIITVTRVKSNPSG